MTVRLNHQNRSRVLQSAIDDVIDPEREKLRKEENAILQLVLQDIARTHDLSSEYEQARRLTSLWISECATLYIEVAGTRVELKPYSVGGKSRTLLPSILAQRGAKFTRDHPLTERILRLYGDRISLSAREEALRVRVKALLESVSTLGKLAWLWPEGEPYWGPLRDTEKPRNLPTTKVDELNKLMGLPKEAKSAA